MSFGLTLVSIDLFDLRYWFFLFLLQWVVWCSYQTSGRHKSKNKKEPCASNVQPIESLQSAEVSKVDTASTAPPETFRLTSRVLDSFEDGGQSRRQRRFRKVRKLASRVTGCSGVMSRNHKKGRRKRSCSETASTSVSDCCDEDETTTSPRKSGPLVSKEHRDHRTLSGASSSLTSAEPVSPSGTFMDTTPTCDWDCRPGTPDNLLPEHVHALNELNRVLFESDRPLRHCTAHDHEDRERMLLRFLRGYDFEVSQAETNIRSHADFWHEAGIDDMDDETDLYRDVESQDGLMFSCGRDVYDHPVMVAKPRVHFAHSEADSERAVRRTVYSLAKCCETNLSPNSDGLVVLYDCAGVRAANFDMVYAKRLISVLEPHFPERLLVVVIINNSWALQSLWALISPLLHPVTKKKFVMCGRDYEKAKVWLGDEHPYLARCESSCKKN